MVRPQDVGQDLGVDDRAERGELGRVGVRRGAEGPGERGGGGVGHHGEVVPGQAGERIDVGLGEADHLEGDGPPDVDATVGHVAGHGGGSDEPDLLVGPAREAHRDGQRVIAQDPGELDRAGRARGVVVGGGTGGVDGVVVAADHDHLVCALGAGQVRVDVGRVDPGAAEHHRLVLGLVAGGGEPVAHDRTGIGARLLRSGRRAGEGQRGDRGHRGIAVDRLHERSDVEQRAVGVEAEGSRSHHVAAERAVDGVEPVIGRARGRRPDRWRDQRGQERGARQHRPCPCPHDGRR